MRLQNLVLVVLLAGTAGAATDRWLSLNADRVEESTDSPSRAQPGDWVSFNWTAFDENGTVLASSRGENLSGRYARIDLRDDYSATPGRVRLGPYLLGRAAGETVTTPRFHAPFGKSRGDWMPTVDGPYSYDQILAPAQILATGGLSVGQTVGLNGTTLSAVVLSFLEEGRINVKIQPPHVGVVRFPALPFDVRLQERNETHFDVVYLPEIGVEYDVKRCALRLPVPIGRIRVEARESNETFRLTVGVSGTPLSLHDINAKFRLEIDQVEKVKQ